MWGQSGLFKEQLRIHRGEQDYIVVGLHLALLYGKSTWAEFSDVFLV